MHRPKKIRAALLLSVLPAALLAQKIPPQDIPAHTSHNLPKLIPFAFHKLTRGQLKLIELETQFSDDVVKGGGKAFASWFAPDGVTLNNGQPAVLGQTAIAANAQWDPKTYHLSWTPEGAQMGPSGDAGFTWGQYDAHSTGADGKQVTLSGRYITFWKKVHGAWKVALDASANGPSSSSLPTP